MRLQRLSRPAAFVPLAAVSLVTAAITMFSPPIARADDSSPARAAHPSSSGAKEGSAEPQTASPWGLSPSVGVYTDYMFRGKDVYDGTSIQPSITGYYDLGDAGTIAANVWLQVPGETREPPEKFNELDTTISYEIDFDPIKLSAGHIFYTFPGGGGRITDTMEYFIGVSADVFLHPSVTFYDDYDSGKYQYYTLTLRQPFECDLLGEGNKLSPYVTFGFATNADDEPRFYVDNGLEHVDVGLSTDLALGKLTVTPNLNFTFKVDDGTEDQFWAGVDIGFDI